MPTRSLYKQLVEETPLEKFDERRVNLLKSQVIQLERQVRNNTMFENRKLFSLVFGSPFFIFLL